MRKIMSTTTMQPGLAHWTADEVAECLDFGKFLEKNEANELYCDLWNSVGKAKNPTPSGGDGSNGTVEYPDARLSPDNDDKTPYWWEELTEKQQEAINNAYLREYPWEHEAA
jgi:hypothetical protein